MTVPANQKKWVIRDSKKGLEELVLEDGPVPSLGDHDILVRMHAAALNYRDLMITHGDYPYSLKFPVVAGSDGAGEIIEVGSKVTRWSPGDRVATLFNPGHQSGPIDRYAYEIGGLGGTIDGTFQQYAVYDETWVVRLASNLSYVEGATLSDAAVTAWNALFGATQLKPGQWVLTQGTGGVSLFAVQFAKAAGAKVVATTSSQKKADLLRKLGADHVINYKEDGDWGASARKLAAGDVGFDHIVEVGGADTMLQSFEAVKLEGVITFIGLVTGIDTPDIRFGDILRKIFTVRGIHVGSRALMEDMMAGIEANKIQPVVDEKVFGFEDLKDAALYLQEQKHIGKVAIRIT